MARWTLSARTTLVLLAAASLALGCDKTSDGDDVSPAPDDDRSVVADGSDTAAAESDAQLITSSLVSASPGSIGLASTELSGRDLDTRALGDGARAIYFPRGCLEVVDDPATRTATYTFNRCMGPSGLRAVSGAVTANYRVEAGRLYLELTASGFSVNRATLDWTATADISAVGPDRTMTWKAAIEGTTAGGRTFRRQNQHTISWKLGESCFALDGSSEGAIGAREIRTRIEGFRRCRRACPDAGGRIVVTNVTTQAEYELRYDGTNQATFVGPQGNEVAIPLLCGP
ncbi:MAG: hypothetical protein KF764_02120 [Labilithrix sp.]|nr:hypothetical protein [Labilithrix sp.]MBX3219417.1 hypothetical protein [Labilithrix sp.]